MPVKRFATLREWRAFHGYTQERAAELVGVSPAAYGHFETGRRHPRPATLRRLIALTGVAAEVLAGAA